MITPATNPSQNPRQVADGMLQSTDRAIDATRQYAHDAIASAESKIQTLRTNVEPTVDMLANKAQHFAHQGMDAAVHAKNRVQESLVHYGDTTTRYVSKQPVRSVLMAAAFGAVVALLLSPSRSRRE